MVFVISGIDVKSFYHLVGVSFAQLNKVFFSINKFVVCTLRMCPDFSLF